MSLTPIICISLYLCICVDVEIVYHVDVLKALYCG